MDPRMHIRLLAIAAAIALLITTLPVSAHAASPVLRGCQGWPGGQGRPGDRFVLAVSDGSTVEFVCNGRTGLWDKVYSDRQLAPKPVVPHVDAAGA